MFFFLINFKKNFIEQKKTSEFSLSLITIDSEHLGIPDTKYSSIITLNSSEFTRICRELFALSETVVIETNKRFVKFIVSSEVVGGSIKIEENEPGEKEEITSINVISIFFYVIFVFFPLVNFKEIIKHFT